MYNQIIASEYGTKEREMIPQTRSVGHCVIAANFSLLMLRLKKAIAGVGSGELGEDARRWFDLLIARLTLMQRMAQERLKGRYVISTERLTLDPFLRELLGVWPVSLREQYQNVAGFLGRLAELSQGLLDDTLTTEGLLELQEKLSTLEQVVARHAHQLANDA